jgi:hypothetical protein
VGSFVSVSFYYFDINAPGEEDVGYGHILHDGEDARLALGPVLDG